jgi:hypothetical protein
MMDTRVKPAYDAIFLCIASSQELLAMTTKM